VADRRFSFDILLGRFRILMILPVLVFGAIFIRLVALQVVRGEEYRQQAEENRIRPEILRAHRGRLLDRQGRVLADNAPSFHLTLDPRDRAFRRDRAAIQGVVEELARLLDRDSATLLADVERARRAALPPITLARNLTFGTLSAIEERMDHLPGVEVRAEPARRYPYGSLAAHVIGYLGEVSEDELQEVDPQRPYRRGDLIGRSGVERSYEEYLRGSDGVEYVQVDALGRRANLFDELPSTPSQPGNDVVLTIDLGVQLAAEAALDSVPSMVVKEFGEVAPPHPGAIVALDPRTGEILAMASRPAFDPNLFIGGLSNEDWRVLSGAGHPLLNRAIQSAYPPGSTFKIITALAGMHEGVLDPFVPMSSACRGGYPFGNRVFHCHKRDGHGSLVLRDAMARSCDIYFYQVGIRLGVERLTGYATACSVGVPTRVDLPQERTGLVPTVDWYRNSRGGPPGPGAALNLSIGQGELLLTPIALARLVAAIANGGALVRPHVLREVLDRDGNRMGGASASAEPAGRLPATEMELVMIRAGLEAVVMDPNGTGKRARVEPYTAAGKTGTSQNPHGDDHALFVCYAPAESPEIVVAVVLEESGHGGAVAAPAARRVLDAYLNPGPIPLASAEESPRDRSMSSAGSAGSERSR
jgi:penicillin-binding protein 2